MSRSVTSAFAAWLLCAAASCAAPRSGVVIDVREAPDTRAWMEGAQALCIEWIPRLHQALAPSKPVPPVYVELVAKAEFNPPAAAVGSAILIRAEQVRQSPEDIGMVIHELAHVLQRYPSSAPGWLVEGIADYLRYYVYAPGTNQRFDPHQMDYTKGYWPASAFLDWIQLTYDPELVPALHAALRSKRYQDGLFVARTKKSLPELWQEFLLAPRPEFLTQAQCRAEFFPDTPATSYAAALAREQLGSHSPRAR